MPNFLRSCIRWNENCICSRQLSLTSCSRLAKSNNCFSNSEILKRRYLATSSNVTPDSSTLAIRREDGMQWERRAPLAPKQVRQLTKDGYKVLVQPSNRRAFTHREYELAGAMIEEDISLAALVVGVKQVPIEKLIANRTYVFFSHTIKAQEANMPMLDEMLHKNIRLVDYECMSSNGKRVIAFGKWAGVAGMIDVLHGVGLRLLALGHHTPFLHIGLAHSYRNSEFAKQAVRDAGYEIALGMMPDSLGPLTVVFTGSGNVSQGAQEVFYELPYVFVQPSELKYWAENGAKNRVYACVVSRKDYLVHKQTGHFDLAHYTAHPEEYESIFAEKFAPYTSILVNGIFWAVNSPRLVRREDLSSLLTSPDSNKDKVFVDGCPPLPHQMIAVCDISADPNGSVEFTDVCTTIDQPFAMYDRNAERHDNVAGEGVLVCSIDNMPAQIPTEATEYFGGLLVPYIPELLTSNASAPFIEWKPSPVIRNAVICSNGKLTKPYEYIATLRQHKQAEAIKRSFATPVKVLSMENKKVLVLGAGYVAPSCIECLAREEGLGVTVVSAIEREAEVIAKKFPQCVAYELDVEKSPEELDSLVKNHDVVISLLPWTLHGKVAESCVANGAHLVTTSYMNPSLSAFDNSFKAAGLSAVMEVGLDPGIDHLLALEAIDHIKSQGHKIVSFTSVCGGLPAPEVSNNPLKYRFSWSPKGVFLAANSPAKFLRNGEIIETASQGGVFDYTTPVDIFPGLRLEMFPNRDSLPYVEEYGLETCHSFYRGTLRYKGYSEIVKSFFQLGLLNLDSQAFLHPDAKPVSWFQVMCNLLKANQSTSDEGMREILKKYGISDSVYSNIQQMGLLSREDLAPLLHTPCDSLSAALAQKYTFKRGERDFLVMRHSFEVEKVDDVCGQEGIETVNVCMVQYGDPYGFSAMSKWVGLPCALAAKMVLRGEIKEHGFIRPVYRDFYEPLLQKLREEKLGDYKETYFTPKQ